MGRLQVKPFEARSGDQVRENKKASGPLMTVVTYDSCGRVDCRWTEDGMTRQRAFEPEDVTLVPPAKAEAKKT
jgi:uncharacterized protein YodC (DUF2158 family)